MFDHTPTSYFRPEVRHNWSFPASAVVMVLVVWMLFKKPDLTMSLNGTLASLVGITANCDSVINRDAMIIGAGAGVLVVIGMLLSDKLKIDAPVGARPVHGIWGGITTRIFGGYAVVPQIIGSLVIAPWDFIAMLGGLARPRC